MFETDCWKCSIRAKVLSFNLFDVLDHFLSSAASQTHRLAHLYLTWLKATYFCDVPKPTPGMCDHSLFPDSLRTKCVKTESHRRSASMKISAKWPKPTTACLNRISTSCAPSAAATNSPPAYMSNAKGDAASAQHPRHQITARNFF